MRMHLSILLLITLMSVRAVPAVAQTKASADVLHATVTVDAIDSATRTVTFRDASGHKETVTAPPEMKRFDELKVGDQLNMTYYMARIYELRKAGTELKPTGTAGTAGDGSTTITPTDSALPGATVTRRMTETVAVKSTDLNQSFIAVRRQDGSVVSRTVQDPALLRGVVAGDRIDVTYTEGLLLDFQRP